MSAGQTEPSGADPAQSAVSATVEFVGVVIALIPEFEVVMLRREGDGLRVMLNRRVKGVDLAALTEGQRVGYTVTTGRLPRVIAARLIDEPAEHTKC